LALAACAYASKVQRQAQPDGSYRVVCDNRLTQCLAAIDEVCAKGYDVLQAYQDVRYAGPIEPNEPTVKSEAVARCRTEGPVFGGAPKPALPAPEPAPSGETKKPAPPGSCFPGTTQPCVGAGACKGGQPCLPDGTAFGPCDCGGPSPEAPATNAPAPR
jgi:hypothetical protein